MPIRSLVPTAWDAITASAPVSWRHINLHGEFNFCDDALKDSLRFDTEALLAFNRAPPVWLRGFVLVVY